MSDPGSERIEQLLSRMTVEEKLGQLTQFFYFFSQLPEWASDPIGPAADGVAQPLMVEDVLRRGGTGSVLFVSDPGILNRLQQMAVEQTRLGIPLLVAFDVIHGLRTVFPVPIGLAASWDADTIEQAQAVAAREARAVGIHWTFAPMVDIARDPRWGRMVEGAGEDPLLGSMVAAAQVRGFQGDVLGAADRVVAGPKHFAGYGAALGGRDYDEVDLSDQELWNVYLPPFKAAIDAGAANIMCAYMDLNGVPATGNRWLLTDVLRDTFGFDGFVVSDAKSVQDLETHHFARDRADAGVRALEAGVDMEMAMFDPAFVHVADAFADGRLPIERLDHSVRRILRVKEAFGLFEDPYVDETTAAAVLADPTHRDQAQRAAERSAVLLRNESDLLPLSTQTGRIAVIGPLADSRRDTLGPWVFDVDLDETVTILDGIRAHLPVDATVTYEPGIANLQRLIPHIFGSHGATPPSPEDFDPTSAFEAAVRSAKEAEVAVVVLGEAQDMIGEAASRSDLSLPGDQQRLLEAVVATGTPTVVVLMNGRPLDLRWASEHVPAILDVWYPGTRGGAGVANLLFGVANPAGKLPFTWPRAVGHVPIHHAVTRSQDPGNQDRRYWDEPSTPLFPFGHGLSYATFEYANLTVDADTVPTSGSMVVSVDLTNTSARDGVEVAQLYLHQRSGSSSRPLRQLKGFQRVDVPAATTTTVTFTVGPAERRYWSAATRDWVLDETTFDVWVGPDATAELHAEFTVSDRT